MTQAQKLPLPDASATGITDLELSIIRKHAFTLHVPDVPKTKDHGALVEMRYDMGQVTWLVDGKGGEPHKHPSWLTLPSAALKPQGGFAIGKGELEENEEDARGT